MADLLLDRLLKFYKETPNYACSHILDKEGEIRVSLTISQWIDQAKALASSFEKNGIQPGDRVIVSLPTSEEFLVAFLGLWWIGAVPVPLPEPSPRIKRGSFHERLIHVIADCAPKGIVVPAGGRDQFFQVEELATQLSDVSVIEFQELQAQVDESKATPAFAAQENSIAFIQYTSGSTGIPKGVVVTHGCVRANCLAMGKASSMSEKDRILTWMPLFHDMGLVGGVLFPAYYKTPFYLIPTNYFLGNPKVWLKAMSQHKVTLSTSPNFVYNLCARRIDPKDIPNLNLSCWRLAYNGAEPIDVSTLDLFEEKFGPYGFSKTTFYPVYGMAEATLAIAFPAPGSLRAIDWIDRKELVESSTAKPVDRGSVDSVSMVSVGRCMPEHQILIRDVKTGEVLSDRKIGEICFIGPSVSPGYYRDQKWATNPVTELKTGDLGYLAQGQLYVVDRIKDIILIAGANYYPSDIEREVHKISGIRPGRSVAFGVADQGTGTSSLVIIAEIERDADDESVKKEIRSRVYDSHGLLPRDIILTRQKSIPLTSSGKVMRKRCHELYLKGEMLVLSLKYQKS